MKKATGTITALGMMFAAGVAFATPLHAQAEQPPSAPSGVKVMSYNIYRGGTMHGQPLSQTAKAIQEAGADIVGVQETKSPRGDNAEKLAQLLGWNLSVSTRCVILTRYEIVEEKRDGIKVKLPSGQEAYICNLHLPSNPYQPYQLLSIRPKWHKHWDTPFIKTEAEAIEAAQKARGEDIARLLRQIRSLPDKETSVFVVGDFNEPSHLDWTEAAAKAGRHPIKVQYPGSLEMAKAGFTDAYRTVYPDEMKKPGFTWSPMYTPDDRTPHHDRIDFVYFKGKGVKVTDAKIVGENTENADVVVSPYPSDHRAVVATFTLPNPPKSEQPADNPIAVRVASYNVEFSKSATPEQIGEMFRPYKLDVIGFDEAPDGDWTGRVGKVLGMEHSYVGKISSANHKDKYKTILSRTPLEATEEHKLTGRGWNPASVVRAVTKIDGVSFAFYSLHICKSGANDGHAHSLATKVLPQEATERVIVVGDYNNKIGDAAMKTIEGAGFRPTWNDLKIDVSKEFTYNAQNPEKNLGVIDHILYNNLSGAQATDGGIIELEKPLSDHKPIWAEIAFPRTLKKSKDHE
jgi:endonuclease/exonuclease/phosphatase family metal-dependent hydrolase